MIRINHYNQTREKITQKIKKFIFFATFFCISLWSFFWLPYFRIKEIEINDPLINRRDVEERLTLPFSSLTKLLLPKNNFFLFPSDIAEKVIFQSGLGIAEVKKKFPDKITVYFKESEPKFIYCEAQECFYINKNGVPYETAPFFSDNSLPILEFPGLQKKELKFGEEFLNKNAVDFLLDFDNEIKKLNLALKKIEIENDIKLTTNEGWQIILLLKEIWLSTNLGGSEAKDIVEKLSLFLDRKIKNRSKLEYIDMRFPNKAFYKLTR